MTQLVSNTLPYLVLASHFGLVLVFLALIYRKSWGRAIVSKLGKHALALGLAVSLASLLGSLFYSNVVGFLPCLLCWWQRIFLYPLPFLFGTALLRKNDSAYTFAVPLAVVAGLIAAYHAYTNLGGGSILPCTAEGAECSRLYVIAFGYITIPMMSLTIALYILALAWAKRIHDNDSNT